MSVLTFNSTYIESSRPLISVFYVVYVGRVCVCARLMEAWGPPQVPFLGHCTLCFEIVLAA